MKTCQYCGMPMLDAAVLCTSCGRLTQEYEHSRRASGPPPAAAAAPYTGYPTPPKPAAPYTGYPTPPKPAAPYTGYPTPPKPAAPYTGYPTPPKSAAPYTGYPAAPKTPTPYTGYPTPPAAAPRRSKPAPDPGKTHGQLTMQPRLLLIVVSGAIVAMGIFSAILGAL